MSAKAIELIRRVITPEVRIINEKDGTVEYIASDETLDSYKEIISVSGWRFKNFKKNSPFIDSHDYSTVGNVLGRVIGWEIKGDKLIETVQWAKDMPGTLAEWGWKMTVGGFLKAVSVGFYPTKLVSRWDADKTGWASALKKHDLHEEDGVNVIYLEQEQVELSACVIGANPNAVARAYKGGVFKDEDMDKIDQFLQREQAKRQSDPATLPGRAGSEAASRDAFALALKATSVAISSRS